MPFDLKNLNPPGRFYWDEAKTEWVELRPVSVAELAAIEKRTTAKRVEYYQPPDTKGIKPYRYDVQDIDQDKYREELWDAQIIAWNIMDTEGKPIECTRENKMLLMHNSDEFAAWILKCLKTMQDDLTKRQARAEKN